MSRRRLPKEASGMLRDGTHAVFRAVDGGIGQPAPCASCGHVVDNRTLPGDLVEEDGDGGMREWKRLCGILLGPEFGP